ncbi:MAG: DNA polymerase III subunit delta [Zoogloeaceae bacterium]|jgi:DNA polymerase-3 subunit delta|nr:DNA polymerase III subunit delta [Zoogloeaceae bacterium]
MKLKRETELAAHLARGEPLRPLYVLYGDAPLLVLEAADALRAAARARGFSERVVLTALSGFDWGQLAAAAGNLSLFGDKTLIDLRIPNGKPGKDGAEALTNYARRATLDTLLLITLPQLDWKEEKVAWMSALEAAGTQLKLDAPPLAELPGWIAGRLTRQQQHADAEGLRFMAEHVEGNLLAAHQEIQKLALLYPQGALSLAQIREAVLNVARYDVDDLRESLLSGDLARLTRTLDGLQQEGEAPPLVLWAMCEEIRLLAHFKAGQARNTPADVLFRTLRVWGARQRLVRRAAERLSAAILKSALEEAARLDRIIKGLEPGDAWNGFLRLGLALCATERQGEIVTA